MVSVQDYPRPPINFTPTSPPLKKMKDKTKIDVRYSVVAPFAFIHIYWDPSIYEVRYEIEEPVLDDAEKKVRQQIISALMEMVNFDTVVEKDLDKLLEYIDKKFKMVCFELGINISYESYKKIYYYLVR